MKAVRVHEYGGPEVLIYEDVDKPTPGPSQVLVRVKAASVNPIDVAIREDRFPTPRKPPKIIGSDGAGVVEEVGEGVTSVQPGAEVVFTGLGVGSEGSYAEYVLIAEAQAVAKPRSLTYEQAAAMALVFPTAYYALVRRAATQAGHVVLVQGAAGGVGSAAVQLARHLGATVIASVSREDDVAAVRSLGAHHTLLRHAVNVPVEVKTLTDGHGADVIVETALSDNLNADLSALARGGRIVAVGSGSQPQVAVSSGTGGALDASLLFMSLTNAGRAGVAQILSKVTDMAEAGSVRAVIGSVLPLAEARRAHELMTRHHFGKIVLVP